MTVLLEVINGATRTQHRFDIRRISIGSDRQNDIVLEHMSVQPRHCTISMRLGRGYDVNTSGVIERVTDGDTIRVGLYHVVLYDRDAAGDAEQAFMDDLLAKPHDEEVRLVYADWLEEQARTTEAQFIRLQREIRKLAPDDDVQLAEKRRLLHTEAAKLPLSWRRAVAVAPIENCDLKFELTCPKSWDSLAPTEDPRQRFCNGCQKRVHYAPTIEKAQSLAMRGQCVAVDTIEPRKPGDLFPELRRTLGAVPLRRA